MWFFRWQQIFPMKSSAFSGGEIREGGGISPCKRHKCYLKMNLWSKIHPNQTMGNCSKSGESFRGKGGWNLRGREFRKKICKRHKFYPKINLCSKFHPNRTMEKCSKSGGKLEMDGLTDWWKTSATVVWGRGTKRGYSKSRRARIYLDRRRLPGFTLYALFPHYAFIVTHG